LLYGKIFFPVVAFNWTKEYANGGKSSAVQNGTVLRGRELFSILWIIFLISSWKIFRLTWVQQLKSTIHTQKKNRLGQIIGSLKIISQNVSVADNIPLESSADDIIPFGWYSTEMKNNSLFWKIICYVGWYSSTTNDIRLHQLTIFIWCRRTFIYSCWSSPKKTIFIHIGQLKLFFFILCLWDFIRNFNLFSKGWNSGYNLTNTT
jgi:hypothetical protein